MAATTQPLVRRSSHHPVRTLLTRLLLPHSRRVQDRYFEHLRTTLPAAAQDRHDLESPATEAAWARLAIDHPDKCTLVEPLPSRDREQQLLAACDGWFREAYGPEPAWSAETVIAYGLLMGDVRNTFTNVRTLAGGGA